MVAMVMITIMGPFCAAADVDDVVVSSDPADDEVGDPMSPREVREGEVLPAANPWDPEEEAAASTDPVEVAPNPKPWDELLLPGDTEPEDEFESPVTDDEAVELLEVTPGKGPKVAAVKLWASVETGVEEAGVDNEAGAPEPAAEFPTEEF